MWKTHVETGCEWQKYFFAKKLLIEKHRVQAGKEVEKKVNFINILRAAFAPIIYRQKIIKPNCN